MAHDPIVRKIAALLGSDAHERQIAAAIVLGEIGARDTIVVDGLIAVLGQDLPPVQRHAVEALGTLHAKKALLAIIQLVGARDEGLRAAVVVAAVAFGEDAVAPVKQRLAAATDSVERRGLEEILGRVGGKDAFTALMGTLDTTDVEAAKAAALAARQRIKDASPRERNGYLAQITKLLHAKDKKSSGRSPALTAAALKILGYLADPSAVPTLLAFAKDALEPESVRQEALIALRFTSSGAAATGNTVARTSAALVDLAEKAPLSLARTSLYTLASLVIPPPLARRLGALGLRGEPERAQLAIERLGQMPGSDAGRELAAILAKTGDRGRAEAAATALGARPEAARAIGEALLDGTDDDRTQFLVKLLLPRVTELTTGGAAEKKCARALVAAALARGADPGLGAHALLLIARKIDAEATAAGLRTLAAKLRKSGKLGQVDKSGKVDKSNKAVTANTAVTADNVGGTSPALVVLRRLGRSADANPDDGYALASAELAAGRRDEALAILRQLLDRGYDVPGALRRDHAIDPEQRYRIGFALLEQRHPAGEEILGDLVRGGGRGKIVQMAKAKLSLAGPT